MKLLSDRHCTKCKEFKHASEFYAWHTSCKSCTKKRTKRYEQDRLSRDINFRLRKNLRTRLWQALKQNWKTGSAVRDLGCSIEELKLHIESQFKPGMTWENYNEWHIDHRIPLCYFDLKNPTELLRAVHFTNLQPLWAIDNLTKNSKF